MAAIRSSRARTTGTVVELWRTVDYGLDPSDGGGWLTICEHGSNVQHDTRRIATEWLASPETFCELCAAAGVEPV